MHTISWAIPVFGEANLNVQAKKPLPKQVASATQSACMAWRAQQSEYLTCTHLTDEEAKVQRGNKALLSKM